MDLTHFDASGSAKMVDVGDKSYTARTARAVATLVMQPETLQRILAADLKKGNALAAARIAGIMAAKRTFELIPLCHPIPIESANIEFEDNGVNELQITSILRCCFKTGIEMEALTAASVAALTVYDMCKAVDRAMVIKEIRLVEKTGGKTDFHA